MTRRLLIFITIFVLLSNFSLAKNKFFEEGLNLYKVKKYDEAKFKFEQDIVFNPKSEMSYLYLARIFNNFKEKVLEEQNLHTVILLNPNNEVIPVFNDNIGCGLNKQIAILVVRTKNESAGTNRFILLS